MKLLAEGVSQWPSAFNLIKQYYTTSQLEDIKYGRRRGNLDELGKKMVDFMLSRHHSGKMAKLIYTEIMDRAHGQVAQHKLSVY